MEWQGTDDAIMMSLEELQFQSAIESSKETTNANSKNYINTLSEDEQLRHILAISGFESSGQHSSCRLENIIEKPNTLNLGGDLKLTLNDGTEVLLLQHCFVLCLKRFLEMNDINYSDQEYIEMLSLNIEHNSIYGEPFTFEQINLASIIFKYGP